jgi:hypothetical protein
MNIRTFTLETLDNRDDNVYAVGMSIARPCGDQDVLVFRRDPTSGQASLVNTTTPENALRRFQRVMPMRLVWTDESGVH